MAKTAVFFFMDDHSGLVLMVETVKKADAVATFRRSGESSVKMVF